MKIPRQAPRPTSLHPWVLHLTWPMAPLNPLSREKDGLWAHLTKASRTTTTTPDVPLAASRIMTLGRRRWLHTPTDFRRRCRHPILPGYSHRHWRRFVQPSRTSETPLRTPRARPHLQESPLRVEPHHLPSITNKGQRPKILFRPQAALFFPTFFGPLGMMMSLESLV